MANTIIYNATLINEGESFVGAVYIKEGRIEKVVRGNVSEDTFSGYEPINAEGKWLLPGAIDDQVHFRDPGLTYKGDVYTESRAAVAGGVTTYMEMPNTKPQAVTNEILEDKYTHASEVSAANYSFYLGATNDNIEELVKVDPKNVCGVKVFMGSSTGKMLVDKIDTLDAIFSQVPLLIATHCEDEETIQRNTALFREEFDNDVPVQHHPAIRTE